VANYNAPTQLLRCTFVGNSALWSGGGLFGYTNTASATDCIFINNRADKGGGIALDDQASFCATNCILEGNYADSYGGGMHVYCTGSTVTIGFVA